METSFVFQVVLLVYCAAAHNPTVPCGDEWMAMCVCLLVSILYYRESVLVYSKSITFYVENKLMVTDLMPS